MKTKEDNYQKAISLLKADVAKIILAKNNMGFQYSDRLFGEAVGFCRLTIFKIRQFHEGKKLYLKVQYLTIATILLAIETILNKDDE